MEDLAILLRNDEFDLEKRPASPCPTMESYHDYSDEESSSSRRSRSRETFMKRAMNSVLPQQLQRPQAVTTEGLWNVGRTLALFVLAVIWSSRPRYMIKDGLKPRKKAHITSYLDALRGWAAVCFPPSPP